MKFSLKLALMLYLVTLLATLSGVFAQTSNITSVSSPTAVNLNSVAIVNNTTQTNNDLTALDAWAVGDGGTILHWNGASWSSVTSPTTDNLYSVCMVSISNGWAVGGGSNNGVILKYNGANWTEWKQISFGVNATATDTINATLYAVTLSGDGKVGWAVGAGGTVLSWDGTTWYGVSNVTSTILRNVGMVHNSTDVWAVGDSGTIIHWSGTGWANVTSPTTMNLYAIEMINATMGWAAGGNSSNGVLLLMNQTTWSPWTKINFSATNATNPADKINATMYSISMDNATSAWAVGGGGTVLYWDGNQWDGETGVASGVNLKGVAMVHGSSNGSTQAWAVGEGGKILAWTGLKWVPEIPLMAIPLLLSIGLAVALLRKTRLTKKPCFLK